MKEVFNLMKENSGLNKAGFAAIVIEVTPILQESLRNLDLTIQHFICEDIDHETKN